MKDDPEPVGDMPVRLLVGGLVIGAVVGAIAPVSAFERSKAVPARSDLTYRARRALNDLLDHARSVVQETFVTVRDSADKHSEQLASDIRKEFAVAQDSSLEQQPGATAS